LFLVRRAKAADMPAIRELMAVLFPKARHRVLPKDIFFVAERGGIPVGFCHLRMREGNRRCYISGLGVLSHYREHGVGSQLMAEALYFADTHGAQATSLKVRALNTASKLYLSFGFFERISGDTLTLVRKRPS